MLTPTRHPNRRPLHSGAVKAALGAISALALSASATFAQDYNPDAVINIGSLYEPQNLDNTAGAGQSSWGPAVYGVTTLEMADRAVEIAHDALDSTGVGGDVLLTSARNAGASVNGKRQE